ncbi:MAG: hypothetical protein JSR17_10310 [Proteobacteria bacterium]|nr:hypothetical protein [Pseudomonadota bacterium]
MLSFEHVNLKKDEEHAVISIGGMPFYRSSGDSSGFAKTWFPFFGIQEKEDDPIYKKGTFLKAVETKLPREVILKIKELYPSYGGQASNGNQLLMRFWTIPCLLISSLLGGGLWETTKGKDLRSFLFENYEAFYKNITSISIKRANKEFNTGEMLNVWLCEQAKIKSYTLLNSLFPSTSEELSRKLTEIALLSKTPATKPLLFIKAKPKAHKKADSTNKNVAQLGSYFDAQKRRRSARFR